MATSIISPGKRAEVRLINEEGDEVGAILVYWQDRDAPLTEIANAGREVQIDLIATGGHVGPWVVTHR